jgi:hypothetical protein
LPLPAACANVVNAMTAAARAVAILVSIWLSPHIRVLRSGLCDP